MASETLRLFRDAGFRNAQLTDVPYFCRSSQFVRGIAGDGARPYIEKVRRDIKLTQ